MKKASVIVIAALLVGACSLTPAYKRPDVAVPDQWNAGKAAMISDLANWWQKFNAPELVVMEEKALKQNLDLKAALARVNQARATAKIVGADLFPQVDAFGDISHERQKTGSRPSTRATLASASIEVTYDLDLFGANRSAVASAEALYTASLYDHEALALVTSAEVAKAYANVVGLKGRIAVAKNNRDAVKKTLEILKARFREGASSDLEVEQQKTLLSNANAAITGLEHTLNTANNALAVLLGEAPQGFKLIEDSLGRLTVPSISPGQPSALLQRRPDIRRVEAELIAANADIGVARAAFYPSLNLGLAPSIYVSPLSSPATKAIDIAASLSAPLFRGGELEGQLELTEARKEELAENYRKAVLNAFREVEDALSNVKAAESRQKSFAAAARSAENANRLANQQFKAGAVDYLNLLESERTLLLAKDNLVVANLDRLNAAIDLYRALGGGWQVDGMPIGKVVPVPAAPVQKKLK